MKFHIFTCIKIGRIENESSSPCLRSYRVNKSIVKDQLTVSGEMGDYIDFYYINTSELTSEIPSELSRENFISSHVKRSPSLWLP